MSVDNTIITNKKSMRQMVFAYMLPRIQALKSNIQEKVSTLLSVTVQLSGDISGSGTIYGGNDLSIIHTAIDDDSHTHTADTIAGSVQPVADTIVKRDTSGQIHSSQSVIGETGFKLANGVDISTLFRNIAQARFTTSNKTIGEGTYIRSAKLTIDDKQNITLSVTRDSVFSVQDISDDGCN